MMRSMTFLVWMVAYVATPAVAGADPVESEELFDQMCAGCHGYRGDGGEGHRGGFSPRVVTLADKEYVAELTDEYLMLVIKKGGAFVGKIATMPAWEARLSDAEIRGLVAHIRSFTSD